MEKGQYWKKKGKQTVIKIADVFFVNQLNMKVDVNFLYKTSLNEYMVINKSPIILELSMNDFNNWEKIENIKEFTHE
jgi:hypothetical protein